jgi:hypothetical protein
MVEPTKLNYPAHVVERNIALSKLVMGYFLDHPNLLDALPEQFELVILPDGEPDVRAYNLELLERYGSQQKPIVLAQIQKSMRDNREFVAPSIFVPLPLAV